MAIQNLPFVLIFDGLQRLCLIVLSTFESTASIKMLHYISALCSKDSYVDIFVINMLVEARIPKQVICS